MQKRTNVSFNSPRLKRLRFLLGFLLPAIYCFNAFAGKGDSQSALDKKISIEFKDIPLKEAVEKLGHCLPDVSLTYVESGALSEGRVNFSAKNEKAFEVLEKMLSPFSFNYKVMQYHVIIWYDAGMAAKRGADATFKNLPKVPRITHIKGIVTNLAMDDLPYVSIVVSGAKAAYSDAMGRFKLYNIDSTATLFFKAKGYKAQQVYAKAAAQGFLIVQLAKDKGAIQTAPLNRQGTHEK